MKQGDISETDHRPCIAKTLGRIGDKWSVLVVVHLDTDARRFSELLRGIAGISQKMLTLTLRGLERDGFVKRRVYPTKPPSVEYALTELGRELVVPVRTLGEWVLANYDRIEDARRHFETEAAQN